MKIKLLALLFLFVSVLVACKHDPDPVEESICFSKEVLPIFKNNCAVSGCHDATAATDGVVLDTYDNIVKHVVAGKSDSSLAYQVLFRPLDQTPMPPTGPLSDAFKQNIKKWIDQGAKNTTCN